VLPWLVGRPDVEELTRLLRQAGARQVQTRLLDRRGQPIVRLVGEW
jgi:hypothetical protein